MRKLLLLIAGASTALAVAGPPAYANDPGPCGNTPENHCRPMDCELIYNEGDPANGIAPTLDFRCYN